MTLFVVGLTLSNDKQANATSAPGLTDISINGISADGESWESLSDDLVHVKTTFNLANDQYVYLRVKYTGYYSSKILYGDGVTISNKVYNNYKTTYITSGNVVTGFVEYYKIPLSAFNGSYSFKVLGFSVKARRQV